MIRLLLMFVVAFAATSPAFAADPDRPHPHQGLITAWNGQPPLPELTPEDLERLAAGKSVLKQEKQSGSGGRGVAVQDIEAPVDVVWGRITDYGSYPRMVDNVKECENYLVQDSTIKTRFIISAMLMNVEYFIEHTYKPDEGYLTWTLDYDRDSDLDDSVGFWRVMPVPGKPGWTRVYYSVEVRLRGWIPAAVESMIAKSGLTKATEWVKRESEAVAAATPAPEPAAQEVATGEGDGSEEAPAPTPDPASAEQAPATPATPSDEAARRSDTPSESEQGEPANEP